MFPVCSCDVEHLDTFPSYSCRHDGRGFHYGCVKLRTGSTFPYLLLSWFVVAPALASSLTTATLSTLKERDRLACLQRHRCTLPCAPQARYSYMVGLDYIKCTKYFSQPNFPSLLFLSFSLLNALFGDWPHCVLFSPRFIHSPTRDMIIRHKVAFPGGERSRWRAQLAVAHGRG